MTVTALANGGSIRTASPTNSIVLGLGGEGYDNGNRGGALTHTAFTGW